MCLVICQRFPLCALPRAWKVVISDVNVERLRTNLPVRVLRLNQAPDTSLPPLPPDVFIIDKRVRKAARQILMPLVFDSKRNYRHRRVRRGAVITTSPVPCIEISHRVPMSVRPSIDGPFDLVISVKTPRSIPLQMTP
jgi:hypothetical protein